MVLSLKIELSIGVNIIAPCVFSTIEVLYKTETILPFELGKLTFTTEL